MRRRRITWIILFADLMCIFLALQLSHLLRYRGTAEHGVAEVNVWLLGAFATAAWLLLFDLLEVDCFRGGWQFAATISRVSTAVLLQMVAIVSWGYLTPIYYPRLMLMYFAVLVWVGMLAVRVAAYYFLRHWHQLGRTRKVVLIGDGHVKRELLARIERHPELLLEVVGFLSPFSGLPDDNGSGNGDLGSSPGIGTLDVLKLLKELRVQEVILLTKKAPVMELQNFILSCRAEGIQVSILPQPYELYVTRPRLIDIDGLPLISLEEPPRSHVLRIIKRGMDLALAALLVIPALAILGVAATTLWLGERRFLRKELRCGLEGRPFAMHRLDVDLAPEAPGVSHFLRRTSISELPQLWNVLKGEMSLVGPRPEFVERVRNYTEWQRQRLKVKPGMTGLAQVNGLREQHASDDKARFDLQYLFHWTPIVDLVLLFQTIWILAERLVHWPDKRRASSTESRTGAEDIEVAAGGSDKAAPPVPTPVE